MLSTLPKWSTKPILYAHENGNIRLCDQKRYCSRVRQDEAGFSVTYSVALFVWTSVFVHCVTSSIMSSTVEQSYNVVGGKSKVGKVRRIAVHNSVIPIESSPVSIRVKGAPPNSVSKSSSLMVAFTLPITSRMMESILERMVSLPTTNRFSSVLP